MLLDQNSGAAQDELGASLTELGNRLGITKSTLNSYVQGYSLAPREVIETLSKISEKSVEWFYYGEPSDYIREYLILKGHEALLNDFTNIPFDIEQDFIQKRRTNPGQFESPYPDEELIDLWFPEYYDKAMYQYILRITKDTLEKLVRDQEEQNDKIVAFIGRELYDDYTAVGNFAYGDEQIIKGEARAIYEKKFMGKDADALNLHDPYLVATLISALGTDKKTAEIIRLLSKSLTGKDFNPSFGGEKLIDIFKAMRPALIALYRETTSDEFYDWFEPK